MNVSIENIYIFEVDYRNYRVLAYVDVMLENDIRLKSIKVLQNKLDNSIFLQMPTCKDSHKPFFELLSKSLIDNIKNLVMERLKLEYEKVYN